MMPNYNLKELTEYVNETNMPLKVHFSLHSPIDEKRKELIPNTRVNVTDAIDLLKYYSDTIRENKKCYG